MNFENLAFILLCISISLPNTQQLISQKFKTDTMNSSIQFDELLLITLDLLQQKIKDGTFTYEDMRTLGELTELITKIKDQVMTHRINEQTISWQLRPGR